MDVEELIDLSLLTKVKGILINLNRMLTEIEKEFKQKGKKDELIEGLGVITYTRKSGLFFNARKYAHKTNSLIQFMALNLLELIYEMFPYVPYKVYKKIKLQIKKYKLIVYHPYRNHCHFFGITKNSVINGLIGLCEGLDRPEVVRELQKPLYVALAYIFSRKKDSFSKSDFPELKPTVFDCAVDLALKKGWITEAEQKGVYKINEKPEFSIKCPACNQTIKAQTEYCPKCGLYLLNMIMHEQKLTEEDIPRNYYAKDGKRLTAYFRFQEPCEEIKTSDDVLPDYYNLKSLVHSVLDEAVKRGFIFKIPDYILQAELYTEEFNKVVHFKRCAGYYGVSGKTVEEVREKLLAILNLLKDEACVVYERHKNLASFRKYAGRKNDFVEEVIRICENCFKPRIGQHPIHHITM